MTTTPETTRRPVPELEAPKLYRRVLAARRNVEETTARAATAYAEAEAARQHLTNLETEYRAMKSECIS
jgi:hypothetical protein